MNCLFSLVRLMQLLKRKVVLSPLLWSSRGGLSTRQSVPWTKTTVMSGCTLKLLKKASKGISLTRKCEAAVGSQQRIYLNFRALSAGMKRPYLSLTPAAGNPIYQHGNLVSILGALHALYVVSVDLQFWIQLKNQLLRFNNSAKTLQPLEVRENVPHKAVKAEILGLDCPSNASLQKLALALESGRSVWFVSPRQT